MIIKIERKFRVIGVTQSMGFQDEIRIFSDWFNTEKETVNKKNELEEKNRKLGKNSPPIGYYIGHYKIQTNDRIIYWQTKEKVI